MRTMSRTEAALEVKARWRELYPADNKGKGILCPICGSGGGKNGTGISEMKGSTNHFLKCWNGACDFNEGGSVIDLYMLETGADFPAAVDALAGRLGIETTGPARATAAADFAEADAEEQAALSFNGQTSAGETVEQVQGLTVHTTQAEEPAADPTAKPPRTFTGYYIQSQQRLKDSPEGRAYLQRRGISLETAARYALGYDPEWISPTVIDNLEAAGNSWRPAGTPRIIIPSGYTHYVARDIRPDEEIPEKQQAYKKMNEGSAEIFGLYRAMHSGAENIFITGPTTV